MSNQGSALRVTIPIEITVSVGGSPTALGAPTSIAPAPAPSNFAGTPGLIANPSLAQVEAAVEKATVVVRTKGKPATEKAAKPAPAPAPAKGDKPTAKSPRKPRKSRSKKGSSK